MGAACSSLDEPPSAVLQRNVASVFLTRSELRQLLEAAGWLGCLWGDNAEDALQGAVVARAGDRLGAVQLLQITPGAGHTPGLTAFITCTDGRCEQLVAVDQVLDLLPPNSADDGGGACIGAAGLPSILAAQWRLAVQELQQQLPMLGTNKQVAGTMVRLARALNAYHALLPVQQLLAAHGCSMAALRPFAMPFAEALANSSSCSSNRNRTAATSPQDAPLLLLATPPQQLQQPLLLHLMQAAANQIALIWLDERVLWRVLDALHQQVDLNTMLQLFGGSGEEQEQMEQEQVEEEHEQAEEEADAAMPDTGQPRQQQQCHSSAREPAADTSPAVSSSSAPKQQKQQQQQQQQQPATPEKTVMQGAADAAPGAASDTGRPAQRGASQRLPVVKAAAGSSASTAAAPDSAAAPAAAAAHGAAAECQGRRDGIRAGNEGTTTATSTATGHAPGLHRLDVAAQLLPTVVAAQQEAPELPSVSIPAVLRRCSLPLLSAIRAINARDGHSSSSSGSGANDPGGRALSLLCFVERLSLLHPATRVIELQYDQQDPQQWPRVATELPSAREQLLASPRFQQGLLPVFRCKIKAAIAAAPTWMTSSDGRRSVALGSAGNFLPEGMLPYRLLFGSLTSFIKATSMLQEFELLRCSSSAQPMLACKQQQLKQVVVEPETPAAAAGAAAAAGITTSLAVEVAAAVVAAQAAAATKAAVGCWPGRTPVSLDAVLAACEPNTAASLQQQSSSSASGLDNSLSQLLLRFLQRHPQLFLLIQQQDSAGRAVVSLQPDCFATLLASPHWQQQLSSFKRLLLGAAKPDAAGQPPTVSFQQFAAVAEGPEGRRLLGHYRRLSPCLSNLGGCARQLLPEEVCDDTCSTARVMAENQAVATAKPPANYQRRKQQEATGVRIPEQKNQDMGVAHMQWLQERLSGGKAAAEPQQAPAVAQQQQQQQLLVQSGGPHEQQQQVQVQRTDATERGQLMSAEVEVCVEEPAAAVASQPLPAAVASARQARGRGSAAGGIAGTVVLLATLLPLLLTALLLPALRRP